MRHRPTFLLLSSLVLPSRCIAAVQAQPAASLPACEWCGAPDAPPSLSATTIVAPPGEPGTRLVITGRVLRSDGRRPARNVLLYTYHTNAGGRYARRGDETGNGLRHGHLRGWLRTGPNGEYRIDTIRPGAYPGRAEPAHVHLTVTPAGGEERWVDSVVFDDDPLLTPALRSQMPNIGGSGVVHVSRDAAGVQHAVRDIRLQVAP